MKSLTDPNVFAGPNCKALLAVKLHLIIEKTNIGSDILTS